jgi:hypothetical protein
MASGQACEEVRLVHLQEDSQSGALTVYWELLLESAFIIERKHWDVTGAGLVQDAISFEPDIVTWSFRDTGGAETEFGWNFLTKQPAEQPAE